MQLPADKNPAVPQRHLINIKIWLMANLIFGEFAKHLKPRKFSDTPTKPGIGKCKNLKKESFCREYQNPKTFYNFKAWNSSKIGLKAFGAYIVAVSPLYVVSSYQTIFLKRDSIFYV